MTLAIVLAIIAAVVVGTWLLDKVVDGFAEAAMKVAALPFRSLWRQAETNRDAHALNSEQRFDSPLPVDEASRVISSLPGVADGAAAGPASPHYLHREPGRVLIAVGTDTHESYRAVVSVRSGENGGSVGDVVTAGHTVSVTDALAIHLDLLDTVFTAMHSADANLAVTTTSPTAAGPTTGASVSARLADPPASPWPRHRTHASPIARHLPALPTAALAVFVIAVITAITLGSGVFHTTSKSELCASYDSVLRVFNDDSRFDASDELNDLADKAEHYDDDDVEKDGKKIEDLGGMVSTSSMTNATENIAGVCS